MAKTLMLAVVGAALGALVGPVFGFLGAGRWAVVLGAAAGLLVALVIAPLLRRPGP